MVKRRKSIWLFRRFRADTNDTFTLLRAEMAGFEGPKELAKFWNISNQSGRPLYDGGGTRAERGCDGS